MSIFTKNEFGGRDTDAHIRKININNLLTYPIADRLAWYKNTKLNSMFHSREHYLDWMYYCYYIHTYWKGRQ